MQQAIILGLLAVDSHYCLQHAMPCAHPMRALVLRRQSSLSAFGLLGDLGYDSVSFWARSGGFVSVPTSGTSDDPAPSSGSHPCRVGLIGRWCMQSSVVWHYGNSYRLSTSAGQTLQRQSGLHSLGLM